MKVGDRVKRISGETETDDCRIYAGDVHEVTCVDTGGWLFLKECNRPHNPENFKLIPQCIVIDGEETYLATAEELAKDWEGKEIQDGSKWLEIVGARTEINNGYTTFDYADGRWVLYSDQLIPYRLAPKKKTLRDVVYNTTSLFEGYDNLLRKTDAERIAAAIEENFEVTPKQGENK